MWHVLRSISLICTAVLLLAVLVDGGDPPRAAEPNVVSRNKEAADANELSTVTLSRSADPPHSPPSPSKLAESHPRSDLCGQLSPTSPRYAVLRCDCVAEVHAADALVCHLGHAVVLSPAQLRALAGDATEETSAWGHTARILSFGTRAPGDAGWGQTLQYIRWTMEELGWEVSTDAFEARTPAGPQHMQNLIATFNPAGGECALDVAAHLDSKRFAGFEFVGASDSAASLGIMLQAAQKLTPALNEKLAGAGQMPCLRLLFFDGEEAVKTWTATDSLYGSRHLAAVWGGAGAQFGFGSRLLDSVRTLVVLDLLGCARPALRSRFEATLPLFERMRAVEQRLRDAHLLQGAGGAHGGSYFADHEPDTEARSISDDDVPFLRQGTPVLHAIPVPFPAVWHKPTDTLAALDAPTLHDLALIVRATIAEVYALPVR